MWSSSPVCARPVRTFWKSFFRVSTDRAIFCSAVFFTSAIDIESSLRLAMDERALVLAHHHALERTGLEDREHLEQHVLVAAQRERRGVHHIQVLDDGFVEGELGVA